MNEVEISHWSGIWIKDRTIRVGVRLTDGRDALLKAFESGGERDGAVVYQLLIKGDEHHDEFLIPSDLESAIRARLELERGTKRSVSLRDLKLF